jgi:uncharacterized protein (DUF1810 family)
LIADPFDLERFVNAQDGTYERALAELRAGRKRTHWMWFIFPQLRGLGSSATAQYYGLSSLDEARAYLAHAVLGPRLGTCAQALLDLAGPSLHEIFGSPDDLKFGSSMTLFALADGTADCVFRRALARYCDGRLDERTVALTTR